MNGEMIVSSIMLGVGLAMDAFSVSLANGLNEAGMKQKRMCMIAGTFAFFQFLMPMIGWFCVHSIAQYFHAFEAYIPWIALILLSYLGGKMIIEGLRPSSDQAAVGSGTLFMQGVATSIDALSVGFTIAEYTAFQAFASSLIIAIVTFFICIGGLILGKKFGMKLAGRASIFGGVILISIGLEIFMTH